MQQISLLSGLQPTRVRSFLCIFYAHRFYRHVDLIAHLFSRHCPQGRFDWLAYFSHAALSCVYTGIDIPRLDGKGYIVFPPLVTSRALVISIELRPESADGLLLYNADIQSRFKDFISIALTRGHLELRFLSATVSSI